MQKYYGLGCERRTATEIGSDMGITAGRVHQIIDKGLRVLRDRTCFDDLAFELSEQGHVSHHLQTASNRARIKPTVAALQEQLKNRKGTPPDVQFLVGHKVDCSDDNPCPTCLARTLFTEVGITTQMQALMDVWNSDTPPDLLDLPLYLVLPDLSVRTSNCLKNDNVMTLRQLTKLTEAELLRTPNFGRKSLTELTARLTSMGLRFGMEY